MARFLIVDDDPSVRAITREAIRALGHDTVEATGGNEAISIFSDPAQHVDVLLIDLAMPDRRGEDVIPELKDLRPGVPVIVMSGSGPGPAWSESIDGYLRKPYSLAELRRVLDSVARSPVSA